MNRIRLTYLATTVLCLAVLALGFVLGIDPLLKQAAAAESEQQTIAAQNATLELRLADLARTRDELDVHKQNLAELRRAMPVDGDYEAYLDELAKLAQRSGVVLTTATFQDAVPYGDGAVPPPADPNAAPADPEATEPAGATDPAVPADPAAPATGPVAGTLYAIPVQVGVRGEGPAVQAFLDAVQHAARFTLVTRVSLSAEGDAGDVAGGPAAAILDGYVWALPE